MSDHDALRANVLTSLRTAAEVLLHLEASLRHGGFAAGTESYRAMADVLLGQRLWSSAYSDPALEAAFESVAARAASVFEMLSPYTEVMLKLRALQALPVPQQQQAPATDHAQQLVLDALKGKRHGDSVTSLREQTGLAASELKATLAALAQRGVLRVRVAGGRKLYALCDAS